MYPVQNAKKSTRLMSNQSAFEVVFRNGQIVNTLPIDPEEEETPWSGEFNNGVFLVNCFADDEDSARSYALEVYGKR